MAMYTEGAHPTRDGGWAPWFSNVYRQGVPAAWALASCIFLSWGVVCGEFSIANICSEVNTFLADLGKGIANQTKLAKSSLFVYYDLVLCASRDTQSSEKAMLESFFSPQSVAVIGASRDPAKLGYAVLANLKDGGFSGRLYPVNPKADEILGLDAYPTLMDIPDSVDLAVIVIPYRFVPAALEQCGQKGVPAVVVITAGFREAGREGLEREKELIETARKHKIRLIGPNCLGVIDTGTPLNATFAAGMPPAGPMAFMSQSGALGTAVLDMAMAGRIGFSKFASLGNKADVSEIDLLEA